MHPPPLMNLSCDFPLLSLWGLWLQICCILLSFPISLYIWPFLKDNAVFGPSPMPIPISRMSNWMEKHQECSRTPHHYPWNNIWLWPQVQVFAEKSKRIYHCFGQLPSFLNDIFNKYRILIWQLFFFQHFQKVILVFSVFKDFWWEGAYLTITVSLYAVCQCSKFVSYLWLLTMCHGVT